jgi:hypothetical protein
LGFSVADAQANFTWPAAANLAGSSQVSAAASIKRYAAADLVASSSISAAPSLALPASASLVALSSVSATASLAQMARAYLGEIAVTRITQGGDRRVTEDGLVRIAGEPVGSSITGHAEVTLWAGSTSVRHSGAWVTPAWMGKKTGAWHTAASAYVKTAAGWRRIA